MLLFSTRPDLPAVHLLADHLEGIERLGLEILRLGCPAPAETARQSAAAIRGELARLSAFVDRLAGLEIAIAAKLKSARAAADRVARADRRLATFATLFRSGTQGLVDALPALIDLTEDAFHHRAEPLPFLQSRGVLALDRFSIAALGEVRVPPGYLVCGRAQLDALLELTDTCLTALDTHYGLYEPQAGDTTTPIAAALDDARDRALPDPAEPAAAADPMDLGPTGSFSTSDEPVDLTEALATDAVATGSEPQAPHHEIRDAIELIAALAEDRTAGATPTEPELAAEEVIDLVEAAPVVAETPAAETPDGTLHAATEDPAGAEVVPAADATDALPTVIALPELPPAPPEASSQAIATTPEAAVADGAAGPATNHVPAEATPAPETEPAPAAIPGDRPAPAHSLRSALALAAPAEDAATRPRASGKPKKARGRRRRQDGEEAVAEPLPASSTDAASPPPAGD